MKTLKELQDEREEVKSRLIELEKEICRHPEHIRRMFCHNPFWKLDRFEELVNRVQFAKRLAPKIDSSGIWHEFVYQMDDKNHSVRFNESSLHPNEANAGRHEFDMTMADELWAADDPIQWLEDHGVNWDFKQVGYLMYLTMRDEEVNKG